MAILSTSHDLLRVNMYTQRWNVCAFISSQLTNMTIKKILRRLCLTHISRINFPIRLTISANLIRSQHSTWISLSECVICVYYTRQNIIQIHKIPFTFSFFVSIPCVCIVSYLCHICTDDCNVLFSYLRQHKIMVLFLFYWKQVISWE